MKTKKGISALMIGLILSLVFILAACDSGKKPIGGIGFTGELEKNVIIRVLENDTAIEMGYFDKLLAAFNEKYKSEGIVAVNANLDQYLDLEQDGPLGYGPDVLYQANDILMKFVAGKHLKPLPIETLETYSHISDVSWDAYKTMVNGNEYYMGVPVNVQAPLLYYRKDLLPANWKTEWDDNQNDIPDMLENWNEMYQYSKQIKESSNGQKYGYMKAIKDAYFSAGYLFTYGGYVFGENGTNTKDIGFSKGDARLGGQVILDQASLMNQECTEHALTETLYSRIASGEVFATVSTPDVKNMFIRQMKLVYKKQYPALTDAELEKKAIENFGVAPFPYLPKNGDIKDTTTKEFIPTKVMGGVNGYAISSYTEKPNASLAFVDFATSYEMIQMRNTVLEIVPAREDVARQTGELTMIINKIFADGDVSVMPSVKAVAQIWSPLETFFADLSGDAFREGKNKKYDTLGKIQAGLEASDKKIYDAINTLA